MNTNAILTTLAVLGSSTAAMADNHAHTTRPAISPSVVTSRREVVSVPRPTVTRPVVTRPVVNHSVSVSRPVVTQGRDRDRDHDNRGQWAGDRERGHGPVVRRPVVITPPVYQPTYYQPTDYQPTDYQPAYTQPTYVDYVTPASTGGWMNLTASLALSGGQSVIELDGRGGSIDTLMLQANGGATSIDSVQAVFVDGTSEQFAVRTTIDRGNPVLTLDVGHRQVERLIICGQSGYGASYQILGRD